MRMRRKKNLTPRMASCETVWIKEPESHRGRWLEGHSQERVHLEIGCGKGKFTAETAATEPDILLVAIERVREAMVIAMERAVERGLDNIRFIDMDAERLTEVFAPGEVERIYLNFSDPWKSPRHAKRRLTSPGFLELYKQILAPGGEIHMKTDNLDLFKYSLTQFPACGYDLSQVTQDLHGQGIAGKMTDYEEKFYEAGTPICRCVARWSGAINGETDLMECKRPAGLSE